MHEDTELTNLPQWLLKDIVTTRHEVAIPGGGSGSRVEEFYSPRLLRWAVQSWLNHVPANADATALQRALLLTLSDERAFRAYLRVPEAFGDAYLEELAKSHERRCELLEMKRLLCDEPRSGARVRPRVAWVALGIVGVLAVLGFLL